MKLKPIKKRKSIASYATKGIKLADGTLHFPKHEKLGLFVGKWNGELAHCRVIRAKIIDGKSIYSHPWWRPYVGRVFQAIEIFYFGKVFCIANEDGGGMQKITVGEGLITAAHASMEFYEMVDVVKNYKEWVMEFSFETSARIAEQGEQYWLETDPEYYESIKKLRLEMTALNDAAKSEVATNHD